MTINQPIDEPTTASAMPPVVTSLFGPLAVSVNGVAVTSFRSTKARALLAYLLLARPQPLLRGTVSERLWAGYAD